MKIKLSIKKKNIYKRKFLIKIKKIRLQWKLTLVLIPFGKLILEEYAFC
jgi:hypothetical protein